MVEPPGPTVSQGLLVVMAGIVTERGGRVEELAVAWGAVVNWFRSARRASARAGLDERRVER